MDNNLYVKRNIMCIDLKSFFASCECVDRGLDPNKEIGRASCRERV